MTETNSEIAARNFQYLCDEPYVGRLVATGIDVTDKNFVQITWTEGRNPGSRNRVYKKDEGRLYTDPIDRSQPIDPLTIYNAMDEYMGCFVASNGIQTDKILQGFRNRRQGDLFDTFKAVLEEQTYEPDAIHTPRISAYCSRVEDPKIELALLRKDDDSDKCLRFYYRYPLVKPGEAVCLSTYLKDGKPPPHFRGEPMVIPIPGTIEEVVQKYWEILKNKENGVSLGVKFIPRKAGPSRIKYENKYGD